MGELFLVDYSSIEIKDIIEKLKTVKLFLTDIFETRGFDGLSYGGLVIPKLIKSQEKLKSTSKQLIQSYAFFLVFLTGWEVLNRWEACIKSISHDSVTFNTDMFPLNWKTSFEHKAIPQSARHLIAATNQLEAWLELIEEKIQNAHDVFISYCSKDKEEATQIFKSIRDAGGKAYLDKRRLRPGEHFSDEIRKALCASRELWVLVSPTSLESSWVVSELAAAWALYKNIVPILYRCNPNDLPDSLRQVEYIDFYKYPELVESTFKTN